GRGSGRASGKAGRGERGRQRARASPTRHRGRTGGIGAEAPIEQWVPASGGDDAGGGGAGGSTPGPFSSVRHCARARPTTATRDGGNLVLGRLHPHGLRRPCSSRTGGTYRVMGRSYRQDDGGGGGASARLC